MAKDENGKLQEARPGEDAYVSLLTALEGLQRFEEEIREWYTLLGMLSFLAGVIALSYSGPLHHPAFFLTGAILLVANAMFVFMYNTNAEMAHLRMTSRGQAKGTPSNNDKHPAALRYLVQKFKRPRLLKWPRQVAAAVGTCSGEIFFGLFVFPFLLLMSQPLAYFHVTLRLYVLVFSILLCLYTALIIHDVVQGVARRRRKLGNKTYRGAVSNM